MKKSILSIAIALLISFLSFTACDINNEPSDDSKQDAVIAILKNSSIDYWQQIATSITSECGRHGVKPIISFINNDSDIDGQLAIVGGLSKLQNYYNIKGVIIAPVYTEDDHHVEGTLAKFAGHDIPVIIIDSPIDNSSSPLNDVYKAYVGTDNRAAGRQLASIIGSEKASSILAARVKASTPTTERYAGFCEIMKKDIPIWETADIESPENLKAQLKTFPQTENLVFFNGNLCNSVKAAFGNLNVYTYDVYEQFLLDLQNPSTSSIKGIIAQNTFDMGRRAVAAIFEPVNERNIYIPTIYITSDNLYSDDVKPFLNYYNIRKEEKGSILMLLGDNTPYWQQVLEGAQQEAKGLGFNIQYEFRDDETHYDKLLDRIDHLDTISNLKGVVLAECNIEIDEKLAEKKTNALPVIAIDATPMINSPLRQSFSSCVVPDNFNLGKELAAKVEEEKVIAISFTIGGSSDRADGVIIGKGAENVKVFKCNTINESVESLKKCLADNPSVYDDVILTSGNFVTPALMDVAKENGINVCCVDYNSVIEGYLASGDLLFTAVPDTYEMGAESIKCIARDRSDYHIHNVAVRYIYPKVEERK